MKMYIKYIKMHIKSILEYKASFILSCISQIMTFTTYYFVIYALFNKFSNIKGYTFYDVLFTCSIILFGFSVCETFGRGIDKFDNLIITGNYDRLLTRPRTIFLQVLGSDIDLVRISKIIQSLLFLFIALININIEWNIYKIITILFMLISSASIFFSIMIMAASYCFYTVQGLEIRNIFTDGGKHIAQYPMSIYGNKLLMIFTFIIPYACINYYPLLFVLGKTDNILYMFSPLFVLLYMIPAILFFYHSSKRYTSAGS